MKDFDRFFEHFEEYRDYYGDGLIPYRYESPDGYPLGSVVHSIRVGKICLTTEQRQIVNNAKFEWYGRVKRFSPATFERYYKSLEACYNEHGNCDIQQDYVNENGVAVGIIVATLRARKEMLNDKQIERLNKIGFVWRKRNKRTSTEDVCRLIREYERRNGHCYIPHTYVSPEKILLGEICRNIRNGRRKTTSEEKEMLSKAGFLWHPREYAKGHNIYFSSSKRPI